MVSNATGNINVSSVVLVQYVRCDMRHISPRVAFSSHVDLEVRDTEDFLEFEEELVEFLGKLVRLTKEY